MIQNDKVRPTRILHSSRLSYEKMMNHFDELKRKGMIYRDGGLISITSKGSKFTRQFNELINLAENVGLWGLQKKKITPFTGSECVFSQSRKFGLLFWIYSSRYL
jgi:Winged helix-turn-helix